MREPSGSPRRRPLGRMAIGALVGSLLLTLSCGREITGPTGALRVSAPIALLTQFQELPGQATHLSGVEFTKLRATLLRLNGSVAVDRVVDFPSTTDSIALSLTATFGPAATDEGEEMLLLLRFITAAGDTVFRSGPDSVFLEPASRGSEPTPVVVVPDYVGPGSQATRVVLSQTDVTVSGSAGSVFTAQAFDAQNAPVPLAPILFTSSDTSLVKFANARNGTATTVARRDSALVFATLLTGPSDTAKVRVTLPAANLALVTGNVQTGTIGTTLGGTVTVRATASDAVPVQGVSVVFAVAEGSVGASPVLTDVNGEATTSWTLGPSVGTQTLTASAAGLSGSPVTFTATAVSGAAVSLHFTADPVTAVAGTSLGSIVVTARDAQSNTATTFSDSVTLSIGANAGGGTLSGTRTVAAVNGVATFTGVSIDRSGTGYTLTASASGLSAGNSGTFNITAAAAVRLAFMNTPASVAVNAALSPPVQVEAQDEFGNRATDFTGSVSVALASNPGGATLGGTLSTAAAAGVATFANLSLNVIAAGYALEATAAGLDADTSAAFNVVAELNAWTNVAGGLWNTAANWSLGRIPVATDSVVIDLPGTYTVTMNLSFAGSHVTVGGTTGTQTLAMNGRTLSLTGTLVVESGGVVSAIGSVFNGGGSLVNDGTFSVQESTVQLPVLNNALLIANGSTSFVGAFVNEASAELRAQPDGSTGTASVALMAGIANFGLINLTSTVGAYSAALVVTGGSIQNEASGSIVSSVGTGGTRAISAGITNLGLIEVNQPLVWSGVSVSQLNEGSIAVNANLSVSQSGTAPSFTNNGVISVGVAQALTLTGGSFTELGSGLTGNGSVTFANTTASFAAPWASGGLSLSALGSTLTGSGSLSISTGQTLTLRGSTVNLPVTNEALILADGSNDISSAITAPAGSIIRLAGTGSTGFSTLTVTGFTNNGAIELSSTTSGYGATLVVGSGTLINGATGSISSLVGTGGSRGIQGSVDNQGSIAIVQPLGWTAANVPVTNTGTLEVSGGNLTISQTGSATFTTMGTVNIATGRTMFVTGGSVQQDGGAFTGTGALNLQNLTVSGPGQLVNPSTRSIFMRNVTVSAPLLNQGLLEVDGSSGFQGGFTTAVGSTLRLVATGSTGSSALAISSGFTNDGLIELTATGSAYAAALVVTGGTLTNTVGGVIRSVVGTGGTRAITAAVNNLGLIDVDQALTWNGVNAAQVNSGSITADANLTINQSGTTPTFSNLGAISIAAARTMSVVGGSFTQATPSIAGSGTLAFNGALVEFTVPFASTDLGTSLIGSTFSGAGSFTNSSGRSFSMRDGTITLPLINEGTLSSDGTSSITGSITASVGSTIRVMPTGSTGFSSLSVPGFTNAGSIELTSSGSAYGSQLNIATGTLVNASTGSIASLVATSGTRSLGGAVDNQGTISIQHPLTWTATGSTSSTSGALNVVAGNLVVNQDALASLDFAGAVDIAAGSSLTVNGGSVSQSGGGFTGTGPLNLTDVTVAGATALLNPVGRTINLRSSTIDAPMTNAGTLAVHRPSTINGALTTLSGSLIRIASDGSVGSSTLLVTSGFTNEGSIELSSTSSAYTSGLEVTGGPLVNASGGTIVSTVGTGGARTLNAAVQNSGNIMLLQPLTWVANSLNNDIGGVLNVQGGNLTVNQTGTAVFTVAGTVNIATGRTLTVNGGSLAQTTGGFAGVGPLSLVDVTVVGPNAFVNPAGRSVSLRNTSINAPVVNSGTFDVRVSSSMNGSIATVNGSTIRIWSDGSVGSVALTAASGFTNFGTIELTSASSAYTSQIAVSSGTLVNAAAGLITTLPGTGGARGILAEVQNQGTINIQQPTVWTANNTNNVNVGQLNVSGGNLTINQTGSALFASGGTVQVAAGRVLRLSGGSYEQTGGSFTGSGEFDVEDASIVGTGFQIPNGFSMRLRNATVAAPFTNQGFVWVATSSTMSGTLTASSGSTLRVASDGSVGSTTLTMANNFANSGLIELSSTSSAYTSVLDLGGGTLTNNLDGILSIPRATGGSRSIVGNVVNQGQLVMSADGSNQLNITGGLINSGTIDMGLAGLTAGSQYDRIVVSANVTLGGELNVILMGAYVPVSGNSFTLITSSGVSGTFGTANLAAPLAATPSYSPTAVTVAVP